MEKNITTSQNIHCIGVGGSGLSALAAILKESGKIVSGSDQFESESTKRLGALGIHIIIGHSAEAIPAHAEVVVYSQAVPSNNVEREAARAKGLQEFSYPEAVGELTRQKKTIAVCGTHGKTTTTGMITAAFLGAGKDPTVIVGSPTEELGGKNERLGKDEELILEACEYCRSFLSYTSQVIVITNIELDHLDYYRSEDDYMRAFEEFIENMKPNGTIIANGDDDKVRKLSEFAKEKGKKVILFGRGKNVDYELKKNSVMHKGEVMAEFFLQIPGDHNLMNATAAFVTAIEYGLDSTPVEAAINNYSGAQRRFQIKGKRGQTIIVDDYGHHPTEIRATLNAARQKYGTKAKILCIFQPHQYSRTQKLLAEFAHAFNDATEVIIPNIYRARDTEEDIQAVSPEKLVEEISKNHPKVMYGEGMEQTLKQAKSRSSEFDVIITMGAGDITKLADELVASN